MLPPPDAAGLAVKIIRTKQTAGTFAPYLLLLPQDARKNSTLPPLLLETQAVMSALFDHYMKLHCPALSDEDIRQITQVATIRTIRKKQLLLQPGEMCRYKMFVLSGLLRTYRVSPDGVEHTLQFSPEQNWLTDGESYTNQVPSVHYIDALEETQLLLWSRDSFNALFQHIPALKAFSEQLIANNLFISRNRLYKTISATPAIKYEEFIETHPGILLRVPLRMVASYLGVSLKTLTRIRHAQLPQDIK